MSESTEKKNKEPLKLEPDEDIFFAEFQREIERTQATITDTLVYEENYTLLEEKIDEGLESSRNRLRDALLVLISAYYLRGIRRAEKQLDQPTAITPSDLQLASQVHVRAAEVVNDILNELRSTILEGYTPEERNLYLKNVRSATIRALDRARMVAATESMIARNYGMIFTYQKRGGIFYLRWIVVKDERLCEYCMAGSNKIFTIGEAYDILPAHPYCRCHWEPIRRLEDLT